MRRLSVCLAAVAIAGGLAAGRAPAQTYTVLHSFAGTSDGAFPIAGVVVGPDETLYGTTMSSSVPNTFGTVFRTDQAGNLTTLHTFNGSDGASPENGSLTLLQDTLYGSTISGGPGKCGVTFSVKTDGSAYTLLHSFSGADGCDPTGTLQYVPGYGLVGVTNAGGAQFSPSASGRGVLFAFTRSGSFRKLHEFTQDSDGRRPNTVLVDSAGNVFGSTLYGGGCTSDRSGCGVIFKYNLQTHQYSILYDFAGQEDGRNPILGSIGPDGTLYGATSGHGTGRAAPGTVFALKPAGDGYALETIAYSLPSLGPPTSGPTLTTGGALIGVTSLALYIHNRGPGQVLEPLTGGPNGGEAIGQPAIGSSGTIYGTTEYGGLAPCPVDKQPLGCGVLYRYTAR